jgi:hypothetical protein
MGISQWNNQRFWGNHCWEWNNNQKTLYFFPVSYSSTITSGSARRMYQPWDNVRDHYNLTSQQIYESAIAAQVGKADWDSIRFPENKDDPSLYAPPSDVSPS